MGLRRLTGRAEHLLAVLIETGYVDTVTLPVDARVEAEGLVWLDLNRCQPSRPSLAGAARPRMCRPRLPPGGPGMLYMATAKVVLSPEGRIISHGLAFLTSPTWRRRKN